MENKKCDCGKEIVVAKGLSLLFSAPMPTQCHDCWLAEIAKINADNGVAEGNGDAY